MTATVTAETREDVLAGMSCADVLALFEQLKVAARDGDRDADQKALTTARAIGLEERSIENCWTDGVSEPDAKPMTFTADGELTEPCEWCGAGKGEPCDLFCSAGLI